MTAAQNTASPSTDAPTMMSYWLVPDEARNAELQGVVDSLSARFKAPRVEPHVTLYWGPHSVGDSIPHILAKVVGGVDSDVILPVEKVACHADVECWENAGRPLLPTF